MATCRPVSSAAHLGSARLVTLCVLTFMLLFWNLPAQAQAVVRATAETPAVIATFTVESYYRIRWGGEEEFTELYRKNHLPFLRRQMEKGILLEVRLDTPHEHLPEESRWDLRATLVYRDAAAAYMTEKTSEADYRAIVKDDRAEVIFKREERRRFELLLAHWDVNVKKGETLTAK